MKSQAQRRFWWATDPDRARKWEDETPKGKKLPERLHPKKRASLSTWAKSK